VNHETCRGASGFFNSLLGAAGIATMSQFAGEDVVLRFLTMAIEAVRKEGSGGRGLPN
jgi:hypothetical protein